MAAPAGKAIHTALLFLASELPVATGSYLFRTAAAAVWKALAALPLESDLAPAAARAALGALIDGMAGRHQAAAVAIVEDVFASLEPACKQPVEAELGNESRTAPKAVQLPGLQIDSCLREAVRRGGLLTRRAHACTRSFAEALATPLCI